MPRRTNGQDLVEVVNGDLRALLFWATVGMRSTKGGSYSSELDHILTSYAETLKFKLPYKPEFQRASKRKS